jgi:hypothetical protein
MKKLISIPIFIIALSVGLFFVYIHNPNKHVVYVFPTPENVNSVQYKDLSDNCYQFKANEVSCPKDSSKIEKYSIQH